VGTGSLGGGPTNVLLVLSGLDSTGYHSGTISYRSVTSTLTDVVADGLSDTVRFAYSRDNTTYRVWALQQSTGIALHFLEPASIPAVNLNREIDGYNLSGLWEGEMSSTAFQGQQPATMTMDQTGEFFLGTVQVSFYEPWTFSLNDGNVSGSAFQIAGAVSTSGGELSAILEGSYAGPDSVTGTWSAGTNGEFDRGDFLFTRTFR
jgi:hypothetical protein